MADLDVPVRPHLVLAWALLAASVLLGLASLGGWAAAGAVAFPTGLVGATLLAQGVAVWYFPSFTKRAIMLPALVRAAPWAAGGAVLLVALAPFPGARALLARGASALFGLLLLAPVVAFLHALRRGPAWRGGTPFWGKSGEHQAGDRAAALTLLLALAWLALAALDAIVAAGFATLRALPAWLVGHALLVLGALAHLLPRARGAPATRPLYLAGVLVLNAGGVALLVRPLLAGLPLGLALGGAALAALGLALSRPGRGKPPGPRLRDARPHLRAAWLLLVPAAFLALASDARPFALLASVGALAALGCGLAAVSLLALPVVMNQRPASRLVLPSAGLALGGFLLHASSLAWPPLARFAGLALLAALGLFLAALFPLRRPRRACAP